MLPGKDHISELREIGSSIAHLINWGAIMAGGLCLIVYSTEIEQFPSGIGLGEGLAFYFLSVGFTLIYGIYWVGLTSLGVVTMQIPLRYLVKWGRRRSAEKGKPGPFPHSIDFGRLNRLELWVPAVLAALTMTAYATNDGDDWYLFVVVSWVQGLIAGVLLILQRKDEFANSGIVETPSSVADSEQVIRLRRRLIIGLGIAMLAVPLVYMPNKQGFVGTAFTWAELRKEMAVVHVRGRWNGPLVEAGLHPNKSSLGAGYRRYCNVRVLLRSIGDTVVLEAPAEPMIMAVSNVGPCVKNALPNGQRKLSLPASDVWIE